ncbi:RluA family pseudouridine synthase [Heyndrickxia sporothermodurans]
MKKNNTDQWFTFDIPSKWNNLSIETILKEKWLVPKKLMHELRMEKAIQINDEMINWKRPLPTGSHCKMAIFKQEDFGVIPKEGFFEVLFEDEHLLVVNKPAGIDTHPNKEGQTSTLANAIAYYFQQKGEFCKIRHVHRLDKDTSGAILFAKHALSHAMLDRMLNERSIKRTYLALVQGLISSNSLLINEPIGRDRHHPTRRRVSKTGQTALTKVTTIKRFAKDQLSLIQCSLDTGRTHQIRVHLSFIGHPLAGDKLYGGKPIFSRQALHARKLSFIHPLTEEKIECIAPFLDKPAIFEKYI